jgi:hypothetical protein
LIDGPPPSADDAWLLMREASLTDGTSDVFAEARRLAASVGAFDAEMTAVALEGNALIGEGRVSEGLAMMDGAAAAACAGELEDPCCQVLGACSRVQDGGSPGRGRPHRARRATALGLPLLVQTPADRIDGLHDDIATASIGDADCNC